MAWRCALEQKYKQKSHAWKCWISLKDFVDTMIQSSIQSAWMLIETVQSLLIHVLVFLIHQTHINVSFDLFMIINVLKLGRSEWWNISLTKIETHIQIKHDTCSLKLQFTSWFNFYLLKCQNLVYLISRMSFTCINWSMNTHVIEIISLVMVTWGMSFYSCNKVCCRSWMVVGGCRRRLFRLSSSSGTHKCAIGLVRTLDMEEHLRCLSAETSSTLCLYVALHCPVEESDCADGQMEEPKEQWFHRNISVHSYCHELQLREEVFAFPKQFLRSP